MAQWRWIRAAALWLLLLIGGPTFAASGLAPANCFTVSERPASSPVNCTASPTGYHDRWLWMHTRAADGREWRATVRQSRFDAVVVVFRYADGFEARQSAVAGDFGSHWRIGGKLAFDPPLRHAALTGVSFGFQNLASHELLRVRLVSTLSANRAESVATLVAGAAMALLGFAAAYNLGVGAGARRRAVLWHAAWAACVLGWGLLWTQVALFLAPWLAGPPAVQGSIFLASCAIACAGQFFVSSLERDMLPSWLAAGLTTVALAVAALGAFAAVGPRELMSLAEDLLGIAVLTSALTLVAGIVFALRRGSRMARDFALSWAVPILAVVWTFASDRGLTPDDDSGQLMVLAVCALQTVGLSLIVSHRLASVRRERREAREREAELRALADTDPLTGLLNRRGFVSRVETALAAQRQVGLILLDLDHFKTINDRFGHDAGDRVLSAVAGALNAHAGEGTVGRLGGEEFGVAVVGLPIAALARLADRLRRAIAAIEMVDVPAEVSASFGVTSGTGSFEALYRSADQTLYRAKAQGRDRVAVAEPIDPPLALVS
ncbi:MAG: diguanylate cyclase [Sphingomonadaceae bacterium]|nr:diguanylate cyclase [Sphingomonadaceae bacterium]